MLEYGVICIINTTSAFARNCICVLGFLRLSKILHRGMLFRVLHSKIDEFIEVVPTGRILNRFSKDIQIVDNQTIQNFSFFIKVFSGIIAQYVWLIITINYWVILPIILLVFCIFKLQQYYMNVKREIVRLESISRSPIISLINDTVRGLPSIRAMNLQKYLKGKMKNLLNEN